MASNECVRCDRARTLAHMASLASLAALVWASLGLSGCSVMVSRESPLNEVSKDAPTALEVYRAGAAGQSTGATSPTTPSTPRSAFNAASQARRVSASDARDSVYWSPLEPMRQRFARVPNPDLVMVVYPHLARGRYPVPGYVTTFPMYDQVHYALPGEVDTELELARAERLIVRQAPATQRRSQTANGAVIGSAAGAATGAGPEQAAQRLNHGFAAP